MEEKKELIISRYIRMGSGKFSFITDDIHEIVETDVLISEEDYKSFFKKQGSGSQFKLKENITQKSDLGLFDYLEEFTPQPTEQLVYRPTEVELLKEELEKLKTEAEDNKAKLNRVLGLLENK